LRVPHGESGIVVDVKIFTRENGDELAPGVNKLVRVYVAQKRKYLLETKCRKTRKQGCYIEDSAGGRYAFPS